MNTRTNGDVHHDEIHPTLVLLSGGIDSALVLAQQAHHPQTGALFIYYGQPVADQEYASAEKLADHFEVPFSAQTVQLRTREMCIGAGAPGPRVVPGRNGVLLGMGAAFASAMGYKRVLLGATHADRDSYPDCRPAFISRMSAAMYEAYGVLVDAPLIAMSREQILARAAGLSVPLDLTWSCYQATADGAQCGTCDSCRQAKGLQ